MATAVSDQVKVALLEKFGNGWNDHDIDVLMDCIADECDFFGSMGPHVNGSQFLGRENVREGYQWFLDTFPDGQWNDAQHFVSGDRGVSEWRFTATMPDGSSIEANGCDMFTFRDGKISIKDSYRKNRTTS